MVQSGRPKFSRVSDWHDFLTNLQRKSPAAEVNLYELRQKCYQDIEKIRDRPLLVYSVKFPFPSISTPFAPPISIDLEDVDGFTDLAESIQDSRKVDVFIQSPGGSPEATERIVSLLRGRFDEIGFLVSHSAYSAATMLALSGNEIILHPSASLGPIDPQINGTPARALRRGFDKARRALKDEGPESLPAYIPLIEKCSLELLEICEDYERLSRELVTLWLTQYMFRGEEETKKIEEAVNFFANYDEHKTHNRSLSFERIKHLGLKITLADGELRSLLREAHILLSGFFNITPFIKVFENSSGLSWGRQFQIVTQQQAPSQLKKQ